MKAILSERNLVLVLFVLVLIIFTLAHEDSKQIEKGHNGLNTYSDQNISPQQHTSKTSLLPGTNYQAPSGENE